MKQLQFYGAQLKESIEQKVFEGLYCKTPCLFSPN